MRAPAGALAAIALALVAVAALTADSAAGVLKPHDGAREWRFDTTQGPIRVWLPDGYDPATAATVIYVHGYYIDVDGAWTEHRLPEQFEMSGINAAFIVCGAPEDSAERVSWRSLRALLRTVERGIDRTLPRRELVAMAHSGGFRTIREWLPNRELDTVILIDSAYADMRPFQRWIRARRDRRLINVADDTRWRSDRFHRALPSTEIVDELPELELGTLPDDIRDERIVYIRTELGHMELVTDGVAIPMLLRMLRAPMLDGSRDDTLPPLPHHDTGRETAAL